MTLRVSGYDGGRVEAHRLVVQKTDVELGGVVELQMSGVIRGERERRSVTFAEPELGEGGDLSEDLIRDDIVDAFVARSTNERPAQLLHVGARTRAAPRATQHVGRRRREPGGRDRDAKDLLLEEDHAERLFEDRLEQGMGGCDRLADLTTSDVMIEH